MKLFANQVKALTDALDRCNAAVWIESATGERIEMKDETTRNRDIDRLLHDDRDEMDIYATQYYDFTIMSGFLHSVGAM